MPDTMIPPCQWQDTSPDGYRFRAILIAEIAIGIADGNDGLAAMVLSDEARTNPGVTEALIGFAAVEAIKIARERERQARRLAERRARARAINDALAAEKEAKRKAQAERLERLKQRRKKLLTATVNNPPAVETRKSLPTFPQPTPIPDYSGENLRIGGAA